MATSSKRDVTLGIEVETTGEDGLRRLATDVRNLAKAGGDAAPVYAEAADSLDRYASVARELQTLKTVATDVDRLTQQQKQAASVAAELAIEFQRQADAVEHLKGVQGLAREAVRATEETLARQRSELRQLVVDTNAADRSSIAFISSQREKKTAIEQTRASLRQAKEALVDVTAETNRAVAAEKAIQREYTASARAAAETNAVLREREAALAGARSAMEALGQDTTNLEGAEQRLAAATRTVVDAVRAQQQAEVSAAAAKREAAEASALAERAEQALFNIRKAAAQAATAKDEADQAKARREAAAAADLAEKAERALHNIRQQAKAAATAQDEKNQADAKRESADAAKLAERAEQALFNIRKSAASLNRELAADIEREADAYLKTAAAQRAKEAATREQAEADVLAAAAARGLAEAQQRATAAAQSELAAIRESEAFMERYAAEARAAAVASGRLAASQQELAAAFGTTGLRSMQAVNAEVQRIERSLELLNAQQRAGTISAQDLARATSAAEVRLQQLRAEIDRVPAVAGRFEALSNQVNGLITRFGALGAAVATAGVAVKPLLDATIQLDQMHRALTTVTGSSAEAARQIEFLRNVAQKSGQAVSEVGTAYSKFAASALSSGVSMKTVQQTFSAVALAAGNLGLSSDQAKRALEALGQIASKGVAQMEELRQQLGDALPAVLPLLAKELGLTQAQLIKLIESGGLLAEDALPALANALKALGPAGGEVSGIVAEFNRLKNGILEAGTVFVDGPFGTAIGVGLKLIAALLSSIAIGVATISEAFKVAGVVIYETIQLVANRDMKAFKAAIAQATDESSNRLNGLISRFNGTADAAGTAAAAAKQASVDLRGAGASAATAASEVNRATPALNEHGAALVRTGTAATTAAAGTSAFRQELTSTQGTLSTTAKSYSALIQQHDEQITAADKAASAAKKHAEAVKESGEAIVKAIAVSNDDVAVKRAQEQAARATATAVEQQAAADRRHLDLLIQSRDAREERLRQEGASKERIEQVTKALNEKIVAQTAEAEKSAAALQTAEAEVAARHAVSESLKDNSGRYDELTLAVDAARNEVLRMQTLEAAGLATRAEVISSVTKLSVAYALQADSLRDVTESLRQRQDEVRADNALASAALSIKEASTQADLRQARAIGDVTAQIQAEVAIKQLQIDRIKQSTTAKVAEAEAEIAVINAQRQEAEQNGSLTAAKEREFETRLKVQRVKLEEAKASEHVVRGLEAEKTAYENLHAAQAGSLSSSFDKTKNQASSIIGGPTYDKDGFATDSTGQRITAGTQLTPPDGSGDWQFIPNATANGGQQTVTLPDGRRTTGVGVSGVGYWVKSSGVGAGFGVRTGTGSASGAFGGGAPAGTERMGGFGVNSSSGSLNDAFSTLGISAPSSGSEVAQARAALLTILNSSVSQNAKQEAFTAYAKTALAANGGQIDGDLRNLALQVGVNIDAVAADVKFKTVGGDKVVISDVATGGGSSSGSGSSPTVGGSSAATAPTQGAQTVVVNIQGRSSQAINVAGDRDAAALQNILRVLGEGYMASGDGA